jgi:hypothetical protein
MTPQDDEGTLVSESLSSPYTGIAIAYRVLIGDPDSLWLGTATSRPTKDWNSRDTWPYHASDADGNAAVGTSGKQYDAISAYHNHVCLSDSGFTLLHQTGGQIWFGSFILTDVEDVNGVKIGAVWHYKYQDSYACTNGVGASGFAAYPSYQAGAVVNGVYYPNVKYVDRLPPWSDLSPAAGEYMVSRFLVVDAATYTILGYTMGSAMNPGVQTVLSTDSGYFMANESLSNVASLLVPWGNFDGAQTADAAGVVMSDE